MKPVNSSDKPPVISTSNPPPKSPKPPALTRTGKTNNLPRLSNRNIKRDSDEDTLYKKAAAQGNVKAQFNLGGMYRWGEGVYQNYRKAFNWFKIAAAQGHPDAQYSLGAMYENGTGITKNINAARDWYHLAASQGHSLSQFALGLIYEKGKGVKKDLVEAAKWFGEAAAQGDAGAIRKVAKLKKLGF